MLMLMKKARSYPKTMDSIPGDLSESNSCSSIDRSDSNSAEDVDNLDVNGDTTGLTRVHHATHSSGCIKAQSFEVIRVQGMIYKSPPSQYTAMYRAELNYNGETKIRELEYQVLINAKGGREALERFGPSWR